MKAIVYTKYGSPDVLRLIDVEKPRPRDDEVLVKIMATAVNVSDALLLKGEPFVMRLTGGLLKPKKQILGADIAGQVEAVGTNVTQFRPGDEVFGDLSAHGRGRDHQKLGATREESPGMLVRNRVNPRLNSAELLNLF